MTGVTTSENPSPRLRAFLPAAVTLMIIGWGGLALVVTLTQPNGGTRWLFFFCAVLALSGTFLPVMAYLNQRFPSLPPPTRGVVLRQALWVGIYVPTIAWLQAGRVLTMTLALLLLGGLGLIEILLRMRERSLWRPARAPGASESSSPNS